MTLDTTPGLRARNTHIFPPDAYGHYVEPQWCSARLFEVEFFGAPGARVLDPACGWGRIPKAAHDAGYTAIGSDIVDRRGDHHAFRNFPFSVCDFLKDQPAKPPWSITSNPPFDRAREFCERALDIAIYKVAILVRLQRLPAAHWLQRLPLETIWLLTPRPSMPPASYIAAGNKPGGGSPDFCWLIFNKQLADGGWPAMRWLHRDSTNRGDGK
jgi:hypothetical protein